MSSRHHIDPKYGDYWKQVNERCASQWKRILNSTLAFGLAYLFVHYCYQLTSALAASWTGYDGVVNYFNISYPQEHQAWTQKSIAIVYTSGVLACFVLSLLAAWLRHQFKTKNVWQLFLLWVQVAGLTEVIIQGFLIPFAYDKMFSPLYTGLAVVVSWFYISDLFAYLVIIPFLLVLLVSSYLFSRAFLEFSFSKRIVKNNKGKQRYFFQIALAPGLIGSLLMLSLVYPDDLLIHLIRVLAVLILLAFGFIITEYHQHLTIIRKNRIQRFNLPLVLTFVVLFLATFLTRSYFFPY